MRSHIAVLKRPIAHKMHKSRYIQSGSVYTHTRNKKQKKHTHTHHKVNECAPIKRLHSYVSSLQAKIILGTLMEYGEPMWLEVDIN